MIKNLLAFKKIDWLLYLASFLFIVTAIYFNLQFLHGSNVNYGFAAHDEYLTIREVYSILEPLSWKHFFMAIISGDILYYGRLMFYSDAAFAFLPYKIFGLSGLVFAVRMFHSLLLLGGVIILAKNFIKDGLAQILFIILALFTYYSLYFMMVPKPEPHQLFILALFFRFFIRENFKPGKFFILLGMAYGVKFNAVVLIPIIVLWAVFNNHHKIKEWLLVLGYFGVGIIVAVPCLVLSVIKPVFLKSYLLATFMNTTNVDDNPEYGPMNWVRYVWPTNYTGGWMVFLIVISFTLFLLVKNNKWQYRNWLSDPAVLMILCGLALNIPIVLTTKRLYPHYLWTGQIFIWLGIFISLSKLSIGKSSTGMLGFLLVFSGLHYTTLMANNLLNREKEARPLIEKTMALQNEIFSSNPSAKIVEDIAVYFPFEWHVKAKPYHPFSGSNPAGIPAKKIYWTSLIDTSIIKERSPDYIFMGRSYNKTVSNPVSKKDSVLLDLLNRGFTKLTVNENLIYWRKK